MMKADMVLKYLLLSWTCICIILAVIYTYIQIKIYFDNEDVSTISFQQFEKKFVEGNFLWFTHQVDILGFAFTSTRE